MRVFFAKIFLCLAVGLLLGHQFIAHHHHEDPESISVIHYQNEDADHDHENFPAHHITHLFTFTASAGITVAKDLTHDLYFVVQSEFALNHFLVLKKKRDYVEVRPPLIKPYEYFLLRAPPFPS